MTNLVTAKTLDQIALKGIKADWVRHDGQIIELRLTDEAGRTVTVFRTNDYSRTISVMIPEPPKMVPMHVLHGEVAGIPIKKAFEHDYEAANARNQFPIDADLAIDKVELPADGDGVVQPEADELNPF